MTYAHETPPIAESPIIESLLSAAGAPRATLTPTLTQARPDDAEHARAMIRRAERDAEQLAPVEQLHAATELSGDLWDAVRAAAGRIAATPRATKECDTSRLAELAAAARDAERLVERALLAVVLAHGGTVPERARACLWAFARRTGAHEDTMTDAPGRASRTTEATGEQVPPPWQATSGATPANERTGQPAGALSKNGAATSAAKGGVDAAALAAALGADGYGYGDGYGDGYRDDDGTQVHGDGELAATSGAMTDAVTDAVTDAASGAAGGRGVMGDGDADEETRSERAKSGSVVTRVAQGPGLRPAGVARPELQVASSRPAKTSPERLEALREALTNGALRDDRAVEVGAGARSAADVKQSEAIKALLRTRANMGSAALELTTRERATSELGQLRGCVERDMEGWRDLPEQLHFDVFQWLVHRLRALQDTAGANGLLQAHELDELNRLFKSATKYSADARPGFVRGLSRKHQPSQGSWAEDAMPFERRIDEALGRPVSASGGASSGALDGDDILRRLCDAANAADGADGADGTDGTEWTDRTAAAGAPDSTLAERLAEVTRLMEQALDAGVKPDNTRLLNVALRFPDEVKKRGKLKKLRKAIQHEHKRLEQEAEREAARTDAVPADWAWLAVTEGRRAVLVGGDAREQRREELEQLFRFGSLEWMATASHGRNNARALEARMRNGSLDLVIFLQPLVGHLWTDAGFANKNTPATPVLSEGYGAVQIRRAIERYCRLDDGSAAAD